MQVKTKSRKTLKKQCDLAWSEAIHSKSNCEKCGGPGHNAHHIIGRTNHTLRWDLRNGCLLCFKCHFAAHNNPLDFMEWFRNYRTDDYYYLRSKQNEISKYLDYERILDGLRR